MFAVHLLRSTKTPRGSSPWACDSATWVLSHIEAGRRIGSMPTARGLRSTRATSLARSSQRLLVGTLCDIDSTSHHRPMFGGEANRGRLAMRRDTLSVAQSASSDPEKKAQPLHWLGFRKTCCCERLKQPRTPQDSHLRKLLTAAHTYSQNWSRITSISRPQSHTPVKYRAALPSRRPSKRWAAGLFRPQSPSRARRH